jgi:hypothetical protein
VGATVESVRLGIEEAACNILENLQQHLRADGVDYESFREMHYFHIRYCAARFAVLFPEHALLGKRAIDLKPAIEEVIRHVVESAAVSSLKTFNSVVVLSFSENHKQQVRTMKV